MRVLQTFALVALLPAALNAAPASARAGGVAVPLCTGDGAARTVRLPLGRPDIPGADMPGCCAKGCQSGGARKRAKGCCETDED